MKKCLMFEMDTNELKLCLKWTQMNSNYDTFSNIQIFVTTIVQYFLVFLYSTYYLHVTVSDDIDELCHQDIEQLKKRLDEELKEMEWVCHELEKAKKEIIHKIQQFKRKCMEIQEELSQYKSGSKQHIANGKLYLIHILIIKHIQLVHVTHVCVIIL